MVAAVCGRFHEDQISLWTSDASDTAAVEAIRCGRARCRRGALGVGVGVCGGG